MPHPHEPTTAALATRQVRRLRIASLALSTAVVLAVPSLRTGDLVAPWQLHVPPTSATP